MFLSILKKSNERQKKQIRFYLVIVYSFITFAGILLGLGNIEFYYILIIAGIIAVAALLIRYWYRALAWYIFLLLSGYMLLGKGFAYVGIQKYYVSEFGIIMIVFVTCLAIFSLEGGINRHFSLGVIFLIVFMGWGTLRTLPFLPKFGFTALRDAVIWGYAVYALAVVYVFPHAWLLKYSLLFYKRLIIIALIWWPVAFIFSRLIENPIPNFPGAPTSLLNLKSGDVGVHLAGIGAFLILRLDRWEKPWSKMRVILMWLLWVANWLGYGATNRGGMLSALVGIITPIVLKPKLMKKMLIIGLLFGLLLSGLYITDTQIELYGPYEISFKQLVINFSSIFNDNVGKWSATRDWRLSWWKKIVNYTIKGEYFFFGKGYGINLAKDDGFVTWTGQEIPNRHPHNATFNILARSGVPGLSIWFLLLGWVIFNLWRRVVTQKKSVFSRKFSIWLLSYLGAFLLNSSVDVFLGGPMGGIWFWSIIGLSLVYLFLNKEGDRVVFE